MAEHQIRPIDVAEYVLKRTGPISAMKLQKLLYYCQAWSLVWTENELFPEDFQAWANGPVLPSLYQKHRGMYRLESGTFKGGNADALSEDQRDVVERVLKFYGSKDPQWLSDLTHREAPWVDARHGLPDGANCSNPIPKDAMLEYYSSLK